MSKLTEEQKSKNKEAKKLRDRDFNQRKKAFRSEMDAAQSAIVNGPPGLLVETTSHAWEEALAAKRAAVERINRQIAELQFALTQTEEPHNALIAPLGERRTEAINQKLQAERAARQEIEARYADVANCWSAAAWKDLKDYLPLVEACRHHGDSEPTNDLRSQQKILAQDAFASFNFGDDLTVVGADSWDVDTFDGKDDWTKVVYVVVKDEGPDADSHKVSFHVAFNSGTTTTDEAYAYWCENGAEFGEMPSIERPGEKG